MHKKTMNLFAVLSDLGLYGGGVISKPVALLDLRHTSCAIVFLYVQVICCDKIGVFSGFIVLFLLRCYERSSVHD